MSGALSTCHRRFNQDSSPSDPPTTPCEFHRNLKTCAGGVPRAWSCARQFRHPAFTLHFCRPCVQPFQCPAQKYVRLFIVLSMSILNTDVTQANLHRKPCAIVRCQRNFHLVVYVGPGKQSRGHIRRFTFREKDRGLRHDQAASSGVRNEGLGTPPHRHAAALV